jgi:hypothetical protein
MFLSFCLPSLSTNFVSLFQSDDENGEGEDEEMSERKSERNEDAVDEKHHQEEEEEEEEEEAEVEEIKRPGLFLDLPRPFSNS